MNVSKTFIPFVALIFHWKKKPFQLILIVTGLITATALWSGIQAINAEAKKSYSNATTTVNLLSKDIIVSKNKSNFDEESFSILRKLGWMVTPVIEGKLEKGDITVVGVDPISSDNSSLMKNFNKQFSLHDFIAKPSVKYATLATKEKIKQKQGFSKIYTSKTVPEGKVLMDIGAAQEILSLQGKLTRLEFVSNVPHDIRILNNLGLRIISNNPTNDLEELTKSFHLNLTAFGLLSYLVGLFIVHSTVGLAFEQRKGIMRTFRCIGISTNQIMICMVLEIIIIALVSSIMGIFLGTIIASMLLPDVASTLSGLFGASLENKLTTTWFFWIKGMGMGLIGALASSSLIFYNITKLKPLETALPEAWLRETHNNFYVKIILIILISLLSIWLFLYADGLVSAFFLLASVLLVAVLTLPIILWLTVTLFAKLSVSQTIVNWFWADTRQQIGSLSISLMALLIALSINIGVSGMVESFRKTFSSWLDQRLIAELYLKLPNNEQTLGILTFLEKNVDTILPVVKSPIRISNQPVDIFGFLPHKTYENHWPLIAEHENTWKLIKNGHNLLINEQLARRLNLGLGDEIQFKADKVPVSMKIAGIYSDYGNPKGQIMIPLFLFKEFFPEIKATQFALRLSDKYSNELKDLLTEEFELNEKDIVNQTDIKKLSKSIFEQTFTVTSALSLLTLGVAGLALFTTLTTLSENRIGQLAPLWALGLNRKTIIKLEIFRTLLLTLFTTSFAIPIGVLVAKILTDYVNLEAFDWQLPLFHFPMHWLKLFLATVIITVLAMSFPIIKLQKASPARLLRVFSYDR